jgi:Domain of Unknown Function (DUF1259)
MRMNRGVAAVAAVCGALAAVFAAAPARAAGLPAKQLADVFGSSGRTLPGGVLKWTWPRRDLKVRVDKVDVAPGLALTSWAAFVAVDERNAMVVGDLALLPHEVGPVIHALHQNYLDVTALHNHLLGEHPRVMYVHFSGGGNPVILAKALLGGLKQSATPLQPASPEHLLKASDAEPAWAAAVEKALGRKGTYQRGVLSVNVPRSDDVRMGVFHAPHALGIASALNFQAAGDAVASAGDLVLVASEVNTVIGVLDQNHVEVTALHNHMLDFTPPLFFMHYWTVGSPDQVGAALGATLNRMNVKPAP